MGILDQVMQMRNQGIADQDIVSQLQEQGVNPRSINDALNQANIKSAVGNGMENVSSIQYGDDLAPAPMGSPNTAPSRNQAQEYADDVYVPQEQAPQQQYSYPSTAPQEYTYQENYQPEQYAGTDADTMMEIAQQVFSEKIKKIQQQIEDLNEFRTVYQARADSMNERLKKIEGMIDRLQSSILEKVGSYGSGIESVRKELSMMQDTYGKIVDAVSDSRQHREGVGRREYHESSQPSAPSIAHRKSHSSKRHSRKK
jgi:hypothetical protein